MTDEGAGKVLLVGGDEELARLFSGGLERRAYQCTVVVDPRRAEQLLEEEEEDFDVVVVDAELRGADLNDFCGRIRRLAPQVTTIVVGPPQLDMVVGAMRGGAYDYVQRPVKIDVLAIALERAVEHRELRAEVRRLRRAVRSSRTFEGLQGDSPVMRGLFKLLERISRSEASVLIAGETGTGKEVAARAIHARSNRAEGAFVALNCAAVPEALLESELFGHVKGAFTDARTSRQGLFVQASGGTIFLDEIGDMPRALQPKLLRALQDKKVRPVGGDTEVSFDARVISATHRDLETMVAEGTFREDLYYRLNVIQVDMPPLRARGVDILNLAQHFVTVYAARSNQQVTGIDHEAAKRILEYTWPGNVRELENCMERAVALTDEDQELITVDDLPAKVRQFRRNHVLVDAADPDEYVTMDTVEERYIRRVLHGLKGNRTLAARTLGFDRKTLYRKIKRYGIDIDDPEK